MIDKKYKLILLLSLLNEAYGDLKSIVLNLEEFITLHSDIDKFRLKELLDDFINIERKVIEVMNYIKKEIERL
ncbi:MAG TPA: hypothetical protein EYH00_00160 [Archaeoglobus profundus]|nr:hypothetical protein [Archaeoglobus profundus]